MPSIGVRRLSVNVRRPLLAHKRARMSPVTAASPSQRVVSANGTTRCGKNMSNDLRQHKDNKPLRRICARVICCKDGNVLVIKRHKYGEDYYVLPGGGIDPQETDFVAAERELLEETGVTAKALDLLTILPGSEKHSEQRVILCEYISGEPLYHQIVRRRAVPITAKTPTNHSGCR